MQRLELKSSNLRNNPDTNTSPNFIERFSNDRRKTKTKESTPTNHNRSRQRHEPSTISTCNPLKAWETISRVHGAVASEALYCDTTRSKLPHLLKWGQPIHEIQCWATGIIKSSNQHVDLVCGLGFKRKKLNSFFDLWQQITLHKELTKVSFDQVHLHSLSSDVM